MLCLLFFLLELLSLSLFSFLSLVARNVAFLFLVLSMTRPDMGFAKKPLKQQQQQEEEEADLFDKVGQAWTRTTSALSSLYSTAKQKISSFFTSSQDGGNDDL